MIDDLAQKWDERYRAVDITTPQAAPVLRENCHLLPCRGRALDLACGLGGNALLLAESGLDTVAWDISQVAIDRLNALAMNAVLLLKGAQRDVVAQPPEPNSFDVIVVSRFLERTLTRALQAALRPNGLLFYQTFTKTRAVSGGPSNPDFLLDDNELLRLFASLRVRVYREENRAGDLTQGFRNEAMLVAQTIP